MFCLLYELIQSDKNTHKDQWRKIAKFWGASAKGTRFVWGSGGMPPPQKIFKIWIPEMAFAAFWEHILWKKQ
jgi:hypothetical protein